ncbi:hypothetical protein FNB79_06615 [Formosa sediminum]|uniref:Uncharacterized protein n=1 Tax=Formosa sediminum TaxID=2594004 RepID=A0A516GQ82_9FLAO|nr:hypothetical protein [Formosa sediminum]QDO93659.1 hypothetical protein FNB79_06615 [Formosa sediminum]
MVTKLHKNPFPANRIGKRREVRKNELLFDLKENLEEIFFAFNKAVKKFNSISALFPPEAKVRFDANVLNTAIVESLQNAFPTKWKWGKYKRFILKLDDYIILIKKFNNNNKPMNIKTKHVNTISNQQCLPLFDSDVYQDDPILFFGYKVDRMGEIYSPQIVYIDSDNVQWIVSEDDVFKDNEKSFNKATDTNSDVKVTLKVVNIRSKSSDE